MRDGLRGLLGKMGILEGVRRVRRQRQLRLMRERQRSRFPSVDRADLPVVLGNAMAKSGSHILSQFLLGLEDITPLVFTNWRPIRTLNSQGRPRESAEVTAQLEAVHPGDIVWGYLPARREFLDWFREARAVSYFVYRDPRDKIVSHVLYALNIHKGHAMNQFYAGLETMEERIHHTIVGVPGMVEPVHKTYESYWAWLSEPGVLALRYEDLVSDRQNALDRMLDFLEQSEIPLGMAREQAYRHLNEAMSPRHSPTFRSGTTGDWRDHFTEANVSTFRQETGDLLARLGYSAD